MNIIRRLDTSNLKCVAVIVPSGCLHQAY